MSTYNKSLPKVSGICFMAADRTGQTTSLIMPFGGVIPSGNAYVGWKQNSYAYSYQMQYMVTARMTPARQLETGSQTTKTGWKYFNPAWSGDVDTFNKCVAPDKKNKYYRYYSLAGTSLMTKGTYDKLTITVRVRSFNAKKKQHGAWTTASLTIRCTPTVSIYKAVALADGGMKAYLNTNGWTRGNSNVILKEIKGANGVDILKAMTTCEVSAIGGEEAADYPYFELAGSSLSSSLKQNTTYTLEAVFRTADGINHTMAGDFTTEDISAVIDEPVVAVVRDDDSGELEITLTKSDTTDDWDDVTAWLYTADGRIDAVASSGSNDTARKYKFMPPLDLDVRLAVGISNDLGGYFQKTYSKTDIDNLRAFDSFGRVIVNYTDGTDTQPEGRFYGSKNVQMNYDVEYSTDAERESETELPFGRKRPVAFLGDGINMTLTVKGNIDSTGELETAANSSYSDWLEFQKQQGIVLLRLPEGQMYQALCTKLTLDQEDEFDESRTVSMTLKEVDI